MSSLQETLLEFLRNREAEYEFRRQEFEELDRQISRARGFLRQLGYKFEGESCDSDTDITIPTEESGKTSTTGTTSEDSSGDSKATSSKRRGKPRSEWVSDEQLRDWFKAQEEWFTQQDLADYFSRTRSWAGLQVRKFSHMLVKLDRENGRGPERYRYLKPENATVRRNDDSESRSRPVESLPIAGTGKFAIHNKEVKRIVDSARANGCSARKLANGHIELSKNGASIQISNSPSTNGAYDAMRRQIRRVLKVSV